MRHFGNIRALLALAAISAWGGVACGRAAAEEAPQAHFRGIMDSVFGPGSWRETGGYRSPAREDQLRMEGALTVPAGVLSAHSKGRPGAPGAYDLVVDGVSPSEAAARLRRAGAPFRKLFPEGAHGTQGAHLHVEPYAFDFSGAAAGAARNPGMPWTVADPTPEQLQLDALRRSGTSGSASAQLSLGEAYARGRGAPRDLVAAYVWTALAASNESADPEVRRQAAQLMKALAEHMRPDEMSRVMLFQRDRASSGQGGACRPPAAEQPLFVVLSPGEQDLSEQGAGCASG